MANYNSKVDSSMLQFNIHNDQGAAKSCNFKVDAKYPAESSNFYEDKKSPVEIDRLLKISFQFLSSGPSLKLYRRCN